MLMNKDLIAFAGENTDFYEAAMSYFCDKKQTAETKALMQDAWFAEVERKSGVSRKDNAVDAWIAHPSTQWAAFAIIDATINAIIPQVILPQFSVFADFRTAGIGDIVKFKIMPRSFYTVSLNANGQRTTFRQKKSVSEIVVTPVEHIVTIYSDLYRVLAGKENIADFMSLLLTSVEAEMYKDAVGALNTGIAAIPAGDLNKTGAMSLTDLVEMAETVQALNGGVRPYIIGSASALLKVLPNGALGYRMNVSGEGGSIEILNNIIDFPIMRLNNAVDATGKLVLPANKVYVVSPSVDKLVKGVMTTAMTNTNQHFDNADLTSNFTYRKGWDFVYASAAKAGVYTITD